MKNEEVTIGNCRLIHGDCREVLPTLPKVDAVVTDRKTKAVIECQDNLDFMRSLKKGSMAAIAMRYK